MEPNKANRQGNTGRPVQNEEDMGTFGPPINDLKLLRKILAGEREYASKYVKIGELCVNGDAESESVGDTETDWRPIVRAA